VAEEKQDCFSRGILASSSLTINLIFIFPLIQDSSKREYKVQYGRISHKLSQYKIVQEKSEHSCSE
jgi:hypothetical protein